MAETGQRPCRPLEPETTPGPFKKGPETRLEPIEAEGLAQLDEHELAAIQTEVLLRIEKHLASLASSLEKISLDVRSRGR